MRGILLLLTLWAVPLSVPAGAADVFVMSGEESARDVREIHARQVLTAALDRTVPEFGPYDLTILPWAYSRPGLIEALAEGEQLNIGLLPTSIEMEVRLTPVRVPVDLGLLDYRVSLIRAEDQAKFDRVETLEDLRALSAGSATGWQLSRIFTHHGIPVVESGRYELLFTMLEAGRFDHFSRGVSEIQRELAVRQPDHPGLAVEQRLLLHMPLPYYFFLPHRHGRLADRVSRGMTALSRDGTLATMVRATFGPDLKALKLAGRRVIRIPNPYLPPRTPDIPPPVISLY